MKIAHIVNNDLANGPGIRTSIFVSGCPFHCPECHNQELWDYNIGTEVSDKTIEQIIGLLTKDGIKRGLSILGGEPLAPDNYEGVVDLCTKIRQVMPDLNIWLWTGNILTEKNFYSIIALVDVIVDGPFLVDQKKGKHQWRGSANQRILKCYKDGHFEQID